MVVVGGGGGGGGGGGVANNKGADQPVQSNQRLCYCLMVRPK